MNFFKKLTGEKFSTVVKNLGFPKFYENWRCIREIRNKLIHQGVPYKITDGDIDKVWNITFEAISVFAELNNKFCVKKLEC